MLCIPGVDVWPLLMNTTALHHHHPRFEQGRGPSAELTTAAWIPTTSYSILAQLPNGTILKLLTQARRSNFWLANGTHVPDTTGTCVPNVTTDRQPAGPCAGITAAWFPPGACCVCSVEHPCLFDVTLDQVRNYTPQAKSSHFVPPSMHQDADPNIVIPERWRTLDCREICGRFVSLLYVDMQSEEHSLSTQHPDIVKEMQTKLATYKPYVPALPPKCTHTH